MHLTDISTFIYFDDTDGAGIVYHGNYLRIFERARTDQFRLMGFDHTQHFKRCGECFVVAELHISYALPARLGDEVIIKTDVRDVKSRRVNIRQSMHVGAKTITEMDTVLVWVDAHGKAKHIPHNILQLMQHLKRG